jgi:hypothetical protein
MRFKRHAQLDKKITEIIKGLDSFAPPGKENLNIFTYKIINIIDDLYRLQGRVRKDAVDPYPPETIMSQLTE